MINHIFYLILTKSQNGTHKYQLNVLAGKYFPINIVF